MKHFNPIFLLQKTHSQRLKFNLSNYDDEGRIIISNSYLARLFAYQVQTLYNKSILPGKINSLAILDGLYDFIMNKFDDELSPNSIKNSFDFLKKKLSLSDLEILTKIYIKNFPTKLFLSSNLSEENFL
ncbi:MAG: hypothetical protein N3F03_01345, partial [Ignavibacteria bacterium]|nr:hypothetical protein [Ignavibacteria bacterium]